MWFLKFLLIVGIPLVMFLVLRPFKFGKNARGEAIIAKVFGGRIIMVLLVFVVSIILTLGFGTVKEGFEGVVVRFDEATGDVKHPGLYWVTPIVFKVVQIDTRLDEEEMTIAAATSDQQDVNMVVAVNYRVDPSAVVFLYSEYQRNFSTVLRKAIEFWAKDSSGHYTPAQMLNDRSSLAKEISASLNDVEKAPQLDPFDVVAVNVSDLEFSAAYTDAIEAKQVAEQNALKAENDLRRVTLEAAQDLERSKVEAEKIRIQAEAIQEQGGMEYVMLQMIQAWNGNFPQTLVMSGNEGGGPFQIFDIGRLIGN